MIRNGIALCGMLFAAALFIGCGPATAPNAKPPGNDTAKPGHDHSGYWCTEHGVPEEVCGQCSPKVAAEFQKNKDWCDKHNRPDSQCFICHPEHEAKFADAYEVKFGKKPPKTGT